jgi:hypothetical protein
VNNPMPKNRALNAVNPSAKTANATRCDAYLVGPSVSHAVVSVAAQ